MGVIETWNLYKALFSLVYFLTFGLVQPNAPVPTFESPSAADAYLSAHFIYTGDPLKGAVDFTVNPSVLQGAMEMGPDYVKRLPLDCDDVGAWAFVAIRNMGGSPTMYTLKDSSGRFGHHVITAYTWRNERGVIDTNGRHVMVDTSELALCKKWTEIYTSLGYRYTSAIVTPCPW